MKQEMIIISWRCGSHYYFLSSKIKSFVMVTVCMIYKQTKHLSIQHCIMSDKIRDFVYHVFFKI